MFLNSLKTYQNPEVSTIRTLIFAVNKNKVKQCMNNSSNSNFDAINELGRIDCKFGLLPAVATIKTQMNGDNKNYFDFNEFLHTMRQFTILLESYSGKNYDKEETEICNTTSSDFLLFEKPVKFKNLPKGFIKKIFSSLTTKYIKSYNIGGIGNKCHKIVKKKDTVSNQYYVVKELQNALCLPNNDFDGPIQIRNKPIPSPDSFVGRVDLTNKLGKIFEDKNIRNPVDAHNQNDSFNENISAVFKCRQVFPLFGKIRDFPDQEVLYLMCYYNILEELDLDTVSKYLDNLLPNIIHQDIKIRNIIKQSAKLCKPSSHQCFISKLLARETGSKGVCVVFFVTFSREVKKSKQNNFPIKQMYDYIKKELNSWEVYMNRLDNYQIPIR